MDSFSHTQEAKKVSKDTMNLSFPVYPFQLIIRISSTQNTRDLSDDHRIIADVKTLDVVTKKCNSSLVTELWDKWVTPRYYNEVKGNSY